jgi:3-methyladenine DNA glycosylase AlkD
MRTIPLVEAARSQLVDAADPAKSLAMAAYMKTEMPFYGVQNSARKAILRSLVREFPAESFDVYESHVRALWAEPHREEKYLAIGYARAWRDFIRIESVPLYRDLIVEGAWWDFVDELATQLIGKVLFDNRTIVEPTIREWMDSEDLWLRRVSIICQLRHKEATDTSLLSDACLANVRDKDFFIRKAIGWALREYAKTNPDWVRRFVTDHGAAMAPLSVREATKHLS